MQFPDERHEFVVIIRQRDECEFITQYAAAVEKIDACHGEITHVVLGHNNPNISANKTYLIGIIHYRALQGIEL